MVLTANGPVRLVATVLVAGFCALACGSSSAGPGAANAGSGGSVAAAGTSGTGGSVAGSFPFDAAAGAGDDPPNDPSFNPCPPPGTPCGIMTLGDSITAGAKGSMGGYETVITRLVTADHKSLTFVGNGGYSGFTIFPGGGREGVSQRAVDDITNWKPNIITLMIGTNDVDIQLDLPNAPARLGMLIDMMVTANPNVLIIVAKIPPIGISEEEDLRVQAYNAAIPAQVKMRADAGHKVWLVDMHRAFLADPNWKTDLLDQDGLHPNDAGYEIIGHVWYEALKTLD